MLSVEKLEPADRTAWETLFRAYSDFYERSLEPAAYDHAWDRFMDDQSIHARGAKLDGRLVGIAHFLAHPHTNAADVCYLQDLFTASDARGQGIGRALIDNVTRWARERGCRTQHAPCRRDVVPDGRGRDGRRHRADTPRTGLAAT